MLNVGGTTSDWQLPPLIANILVGNYPASRLLVAVPDKG